MNIDKAREGRLTWNRVGGLTLAVLVMGALFGVWMMRQRVFLAPPLAAEHRICIWRSDYCPP